MSASPDAAAADAVQDPRRSAVNESDDEEGGPSASTARAKKRIQEESEAEDEEDGDLFGADSDDDDNKSKTSARGVDAKAAADDDDEDDVVRPARQRRQVGSSSPPPAKAQARLARRQSSPSRSPSAERSYDDLELRETSQEPVMGFRDGAGGGDIDIQEANFDLPSLPVRRGAPHFFAKLPNLLQYRSEVFDEAAFDEKVEDEQLQNREGIRIDDAGLRSLLTTSNTIRWRWSDHSDETGARLPESNARIVRWSDGSSSLQLGSEFYDISVTTERVQKPTQAQTETKTSASMIPPQPVQHLMHLFVKHDGQDQLNMYQAEAPILGSLMFRPTSIASESHQRLAKAVRQQRGALVKETRTDVDPEQEKERLEREERKRKQIRAREMRKRQKGPDEEDDDAFWASAGRTTRRNLAAAGGRTVGVPSGPSADLDLDDIDMEDGGGFRAAAGDMDADDDDGFVVDDEDEDDGLNGTSHRRGEVDADDEPDEMDRLEAEMEKTEAKRLAQRSDGARVSKDAPAAASSEAEAAGGANGRRRRIVESDEE